MRKRTFEIKDAALVVASSLAGLALVNFAYILWIRSPLQRNGFPRQVLADLPAPSRWLYPDTGRTDSSRDIALLGDSYVEGSSDDYEKGIYNYGIAHFLFQITGKPIASFGTGGSHLSRQVIFFRSALSGNYWPLYDGRKPNDRPRHLILFFYEGNDLEDLKASHMNPYLASIQMPFTLRFFPIIRLLNRRVENLWHRTRDRYKKISQRHYNSECAPQEDCKNTTRLKAIQGPSMEFTDEEVANTINSLETDLNNFSGSYLSRTTCLVYIPSPAVVTGSYSRELERYNIGSIKMPGHWDPALIMNRHLLIKKQVASVARRLNYAFVDTTEPLRLAAKTSPIYGDQDINHLSSAGYKLIAKTISQNKECGIRRSPRQS